MKDINMNFKNNKFTGEINTVDYKNAIRQKVRNILMLRMGDIKYKDEIYTNIYYLLGDSMSSLTTNVIKEYVRNAFKLHIPEAKLQDVRVEADFDNQKYIIYMSYLIVYNMELITQTLDLGVSN